MKATKAKTLGTTKEEKTIKNYEKVEELLNQVYQLGYKAGKNNLPQHTIKIDNETGKLNID